MATTTRNTSGYRGSIGRSLLCTAPICAPSHGVEGGLQADLNLGGLLATLALGRADLDAR